MRHARNNASESIVYFGAEKYGAGKLADTDVAQDKEPSSVSLAGYSERYRVSGLTHVAIHQSPENHHYGVKGEYRNCGSGGPRSRSDVQLCEEADNLWLGPWDKNSPDGGPYGMSTYNPHFDNLSERVNGFLYKVWRQHQAADGGVRR